METRFIIALCVLVFAAGFGVGVFASKTGENSRVEKQVNYVIRLQESGIAQVRTNTTRTLRWCEGTEMHEIELRN
jgi:hypothetical protein